jgi:hypothetical protein
MTREDDEDDEMTAKERFKAKYERIDQERIWRESAELLLNVRDE